MGNGLTKETDLNAKLENLTQGITQIIEQVEENFSAFFVMQMQKFIQMAKNATPEEEKSINDKISALASLVKIKGLVDPNKPRVIIERLVYVNKEDVAKVQDLFSIINAPLQKTRDIAKSAPVKETPKAPYQTIKRAPKELRANNKLIFDLQKELGIIASLDGDNKKAASNGNLIVASEIDEYEALLNLIEILNQANSSNDALEYTLNLAYIDSKDQEKFDSLLVSSKFYQNNYIEPAQINAYNDNLVYDLENYLKTLEQAYNSYQGTTIESGITSDNTTVLASDVQAYNNIKEMISILNDRAKNLKSAWNVGNIRNKNLARYKELVRETITGLVNVSLKFREIPGVETNLPFILDIEDRLKTVTANSEEYASLNTLYNALTSSIGLANLKTAQDGALIDKKLLKEYEQNLNPLLDYARRKEAAESLVNALANIRNLKASALAPKEQVILALPEHKVKVRAIRPAKNVITPDVIALPGVTLDMLERAKKIKELIGAFLEASKHSDTSYLDDILKKLIEEAINPKPVLREEPKNNVILALPPHQENVAEVKPTRPLRDPKELETPDVIALTGEVLEIDPELSAKIYQIIDNPTVKGILDVIAYAAAKDKELQAQLNVQDRSLSSDDLVRTRRLEPSILSDLARNINAVSGEASQSNSNTEILQGQLALPPHEEHLALEAGTPTRARAIPLGGEVLSASEAIPLPESTLKVDAELQEKAKKAVDNPTVDNLLEFLNYLEDRHKEIERKLAEAGTLETAPIVRRRSRLAEGEGTLALPPHEEHLALEAGTPTQARAIPLGGEVLSASEAIPLPESTLHADEKQTDKSEATPTLDNLLEYLDSRDAKYAEFQQKLNDIDSLEVDLPIIKRSRVAEEEVTLALPPHEEQLALEAGTPTRARAIPLGGEVLSASEAIPLPESALQVDEKQTDKSEATPTLDNLLEYLDSRDAKYAEFQQRLDDIDSMEKSQKDLPTEHITSVLAVKQAQISLVNILASIKNLKIADEEKRKVLESEALTRKLIDRFLELSKYDEPNSEKDYTDAKLKEAFESLIKSPVSFSSVNDNEALAPLPVAPISRRKTLRPAKVLETPDVIPLDGKVIEVEEELPTEHIIKILAEKQAQTSLVNVLTVIKNLKIADEEKRKVLESEALTRKLIDKFLELSKYDKPNPEKDYTEAKLLEFFEALVNPISEEVKNNKEVLSLPPYKANAGFMKKIRPLKSSKTLETPDVISLGGKVEESLKSSFDEALHRLENIAQIRKGMVSRADDAKENLKLDIVTTGRGDLAEIAPATTVTTSIDNTQSLLDEVRELIAETKLQESSGLPAVAPSASLAVPSKPGKRLAAKSRTLGSGALDTIKGMFDTIVGRGLKNSLNALRADADNFKYNPEDTREMLSGIKDAFDKDVAHDTSVMDLPTLIRFPMPQSEDKILSDCQNEVARLEGKIATLKSMIDAAPIWSLCIQEKERINDLRISIRDCKSKAALKFLEKYNQAVASNDKTSANNYRLLIFALINVDVCNCSNGARYEIECAPGLTEKDIIDELQEIKDKILAAQMHNPVAGLAAIDAEFINIIDKTIDSILADVKYSIDPELKLLKLRQLIRSKTG